MIPFAAVIGSTPVRRGRVVRAVGIGLALIGATGCEFVAKFQDAREKTEALREKNARSDALRKVQIDSIARRDALVKELDQATWGRTQDYALDRDGTTVWLWRSGGDAAKDKDGAQL